MTRRSRQGGREARKVIEAGLGLTAFGGALLLAPLFLSSPPVVRALARAADMAWWMLVLGLAMTAVGLLLSRLRGNRSTRSRSTPDRPPRSRGSATPADAVRRPASGAQPEEAAPAQPLRSGAPEERRAAAAVPRERLADAVPAARPAAAPLRPQQWGQSVFDLIEWRRFEAVVERLFQQAGFETRTQSHGADGGIDIWLYSRNQPGQPVSLVQCKHWQGKRVGVDKVRELRGVMAAHQVSRGQFATTSTFTPDAQAFARDNGINLLDAPALLRLITQRSPEQQAELLDVALQGEYWRPTCVNCGAKLVERRSRSGGAAFWGCPGYPRCRTTLPMRAPAST